MTKLMFAPLVLDELESAEEPSESDIKTPVIPVPEDAPPCTFRHPVHGEPSKRWAWHNVDGRLVGFTLRFDFESDGEPDKEVLPVTYCSVKKGGRKYRAWCARGVPAPRPLYRLPLLAGAPQKPVLITEGEKKADRAAELFPEFEATTTMGGCGAPHLTDFTPLAQRYVIVWPDHDDKGKEYAAKVAGFALAAGALEVRIVQVPDTFPHKWDLADTLPDGVVDEDLRLLLSQAVPFEIADEGASIELPPGYRMTPRGLVWVDPAKVDDEGGEVELRLAGKFEVVAETRDGDGHSWGLLLRWRDHDGRVHELALPRAMLAGDGVDARKLLLDRGLYVAPARKKRELLNAFLLSVRATGRARATNRVGWHGDVFVLPGESFGADGKDPVILQGSVAVDHAFHTSGTIDDWNQDVARLAQGNSRLVVAISAGFAAPLIGLCSLESGGLHFKGASSTGKTTALTVSGSVWGGGEPGGYVKSWRSTANGLEGVALAHCDGLLCLDEMSQVPARDAGEVAYMLANGSGKARANRDGGARRASRWRLLFLSSGEVGLADRVAENDGKRRPTAGQQVRIVDIPADAGAGLGIFEDLHEFESADALARHLRKAALTNFGSPIRAFLERVANDPEGVRASVFSYIDAFVDEHVPEGADGQVLRVAHRFGLVAVAGEMAIGAGVITTWKPGEAIAAAARCFRDWLAARGSAEPSEVRDGIAQVRAFISSNGDARFIPAWEQDNQDGRLPVRDVAGFRKRNNDGSWDFYATTAAWRDEICRGFDPMALAAAMVERGLLEAGADRRHNQSVRVPRRGKRRLYHIPARLLEEEEQ